MSIPFFAENIEFIDSETGVTYLLKPPTDEVEIALLKHQKQNPVSSKELKALYEKDEFEAEAKIRQWVNGKIDIVLCGWSTDNKKLKLPPFLKKPSLQMNLELKQKILNFWNKSTTFGADDLKK